MILFLEPSVKIKNVLGFLGQWYAPTPHPPKKCVLKVQNFKQFGLGYDFTQDDMELGTIIWRRIMASFMIWRSWNHSPGPVLFLYREYWGVTWQIGVNL